MKLLLLGKNGQIGFELCRTLQLSGELTALGREDLDLLDFSAVRAMVRSVRPNLIINAAGYTKVEEAEKQQNLAFALNAELPEILAQEAQGIDAALLHYSTDYVFDGMKGSPYKEDDVPGPLNAYGRSKLAGEEAISAVRIPSVILRTGWVYGVRGNNFFLTMLRLARQRAVLEVVDDQRGAPTSSRTIAEATAQIVHRAYSGKGAIQSSPTWDKYGGIYNVSARGETTWYGFASRILGELAPHVVVKPIESSDYKSAARRPRFSVLDGRKLQSVFSIEMPGWEASLEAVIREFRSMSDSIWSELSRFQN